MNMAGMGMAPEWPVALLTWPAMLAQSLIFGSAMLCLMLRRSTVDGAASGDTLGRALAGWWRIFALVVAIMSSLMLVDQVAGMADVSWRDALPLLREVLARTQGGHIWEWRLPAAAALLIVVWMPLREPMRAAALSIICAALFLAGSLMSHAIDFGAIAILLSFVHSVAAGAWTGALFGYWVGARASDANTQLSIRSAQALSTLATWSVLILIASGIYLAYEGLGHSLYHLWYSSYGRVLSLKVEIFAVVLAVGAYNRVYLMPTIDKAATPGRLLRNVAAESLVIIGVMGLAALLASTPPARMSVSMLDAREAHVDRKVLRDRESEPRVIQWLRNAELYFQES